MSFTAGCCLERRETLAHTSHSVCDSVETHLQFLHDSIIPSHHQNIGTFYKLLFKIVLIRYKFQGYYPIQYKEMMTKKYYLMQHIKIYANSIQSSKANINFLPSGFPSSTMSFTIDNVIYLIKKELYNFFH